MCKAARTNRQRSEMSDTDWRTDSSEEDIDLQGRNRGHGTGLGQQRLRGCGFGSGRDDSPGSALGPASAPGPLTGLLAEPGPDWVREDVGTRVLQLLLVFDQT